MLFERKKVEDVKIKEDVVDEVKKDYIFKVYFKNRTEAEYYINNITKSDKDTMAKNIRWCMSIDNNYVFKYSCLEYDLYLNCSEITYFTIEEKGGERKC